MKRAIYPGSFDPVTLGHLNIIKRAAAMFDELIVCVSVNSSKSAGLFIPEERVELIRKVTEDIPNVRVDCSRELLAAYAKRNRARVLVKGLRAVSDYEAEDPNGDGQRQIVPEAGHDLFVYQSQVRLLKLHRGQGDGPIWGGTCLILCPGRSSERFGKNDFITQEKE